MDNNGLNKKSLLERGNKWRQTNHDEVGPRMSGRAGRTGPYFLQQGQPQEELGQAGQLQCLQSLHSLPQVQAPPSLSEIWFKHLETSQVDKFTKSISTGWTV